MLLPGSRTGHPLRDASEADAILLRDGLLFLAVRSDEKFLHGSFSADLGHTWSTPHDLGFPGHCPQLLRHSSGAVLLAQRFPHSAFRISRDECRSFGPPHVIDPVIGAYPAMAESSDGSVIVVYYEEGEGSAVCARRFRLEGDRVDWEEP